MFGSLVVNLGGTLTQAGPPYFATLNSVFLETIILYRLIWALMGPVTTWAHMDPRGPHGPIWDFMGSWATSTRMGPHAPMGHMGPYGPSWAHMGPHGPMGYMGHLGPYKPMGLMAPYGPMKSKTCHNPTRMRGLWLIFSMV
jgi:hypothetical protein